MESDVCTSLPFQVQTINCKEGLETKGVPAHLSTAECCVFLAYW